MKSFKITHICCKSQFLMEEVNDDPKLPWALNIVSKPQTQFRTAIFLKKYIRYWNSNRKYIRFYRNVPTKAECDPNLLKESNISSICIKQNLPSSPLWMISLCIEASGEISRPPCLRTKASIVAEIELRKTNQLNCSPS